MKKCFKYAKRYVKKMDIMDVALLKICLCSLGILIGLNISKDKKKAVAIGATSVFTATYIPLMTKFLKLLPEKK